MKDYRMSRSTRMFEIIQILRGAAQPLTALEIGDILEVSKRTVYRDIVTLQSMRVPIAGAAGVGYIMRPGYDLPPISFSEDEIEAISVGLALLRRTGDSGLQNVADRVAGKIRDALPDENKAHINNRALQVSGWNSVPASTIETRLLRQAIREEKKLQLTYEDGEGSRSLRIIYPLAVIYYIDVIVLAAWCELRTDFRHFRVDRFVDIKVLGETFHDEGAVLRDKWHEQFGVS